jgi:hypothetical protein
MGKEPQTFGVHKSFDEGSEELNNQHLDPMAFQGRGPSEYGLWKALVTVAAGVIAACRGRRERRKNHRQGVLLLVLVFLLVGKNDRFWHLEMQRKCTK